MDNNLFKSTYLKELVKKYGFIPSKKYGQNFLISEKPIREMIKAADLKKTDTVVEIGPGFGVLTLAVAPKVKKVISFEIEKKLEKYWEENRPENVEIVWGNALKSLKSCALSLRPGYKVLANLPYQITSNALRTILEAENEPEVVVVMVQKEVAERICAKSPNMSLLAVSVQYFGEPKIVCKVPKGSFWPEPKVDSSVVKVTLAPKHLSTEAHANSANVFFRVVRAGFASKRKQLWRNLAVGLKIDGEKIKQVLQEIAGNEKVRAQELSVGDWREIVEKL